MTRARARTLLFACAFLLGALANAPAAVAADQGARVRHQDGAPYKFGVFPYMAPLRLESIYAPIARAFSEHIGRPVQFRTASNFTQFFENLEAEKYDIAFIQPFWYVDAADRFGYLPLARLREPLSAVIFVLDDSPIRSVDDLRGKSVATPPPKGPATRMAIRALEDKGIVPGRDLALKSFKSVDSCYQQLVIGSVSACISGQLVRRQVEENLKVELRVLLKTPGIPSLSFVVHPRVRPKDRARLLETILSWGDSEAGRALERGLGASRFIASEDVDYDVIRTMLTEADRQ